MGDDLLPRSIGVISKSEYLSLVHTSRRDFLIENYSNILSGISSKIDASAKRMIDVKIEATFPIMELYDRSKIEAIIVGYFTYLGYDVILNREEEFIRVSIHS